MVIIPAGKKVGRLSKFGDVYEDRKGLFLVMKRTLAEVIEANVTNGRGYYTNSERDKFPGWEEDVREGHPSYSKFYVKILNPPDALIPFPVSLMFPKKKYT